jgi:serine/threonine protein kinase/lipopolysaccharide biosynthesis regulator YciM
MRRIDPEVERLLLAALEIEPGRRAAFLEEACAGNDGLRQEVESYLAQEGRRKDVLDTLAFKIAPQTSTKELIEPRLAIRIGRYRILSPLDEGGMGKVYLAEDEKLRRKIAIKVLQPTLLTNERAKKRFKNEALTLANLKHPNICTIHDIGEEGGSSFIVMEYVEGEDLASRLKKGPLDLEESLQIATRVLEAISYAHSRGIVHRDIKPKNIMITPQGQPKVLDFGLALVLQETQAAESGGDTQSCLTLPGVVMGTPAYMSPEQAYGAIIDARSDLFSVGAVLYECIAGKVAFPGDNVVEVLDRIKQSDPPPPSHFDRSIPSDLEHIILKALAKSPEARYQSADEMLRDLRGVGASQAEEPPVRRMPPAPPRGRIREGLDRLVRPPLLFALLALVVLTVLLPWKRLTSDRKPYEPPGLARSDYELGTGAIREGAYYKASDILQSAIGQDEKFALAHAMLAEAWLELDYVGRANAEILRADALADEQVLSTEDMLSLRAIKASVARDFATAIKLYTEIARLKPDQPQVYLDLARAYENDDQIEKAIENYSKASKEGPQRAAALLRTGVLYGRKGDEANALAAFQEAERLYQLTRNGEGLAEVFYHRGVLFNQQDKLDASRTEFQKVMTRGDSNEYQRIKTQLQLSTIATIELKTEEAKELARGAVGLAQEKRMDNLHANGLVDLGNAYAYSGGYEEARRFYEQAMEQARTYTGRRAEMRAVLSLGGLLISLGEVDKGIENVERALEFYRQGVYRKEQSAAQFHLGRAYRKRGNYDAAREAFEQQRQLAEQTSDRSQLGLAHAELGNVLVIQEQYPDALQHFNESYRINRLLGARSYMGYDLTACGSMLWQMGRHEEAAARFDEALTLAAQPGGSDKQLLAWIYVNRARMALSQERFPDVKISGRKAIDLATPNNYKDILVLANCTLCLAHTRTGRPDAGRPLCEEAVKIANGADDLRLIPDALLALAETMLERQDAQNALTTALQAQKDFAASGRQDSEWRALLLAARACRLLNDEANARAYAAQAATVLSGLQQTLGGEYFSTFLSRRDVSRLLKP